MRCLSCNIELSDFEATRKYVDTPHYVDLCNSCYSTIAEDLLTEERYDLQHEETFFNDDELCDT